MSIESIDKSPVMKNQPVDTSSIDIHKIKNLLVRHWYWFVVSVSLAVGITYFYLRYQIPVYRSATTILLKDGSGQSMANMELIQGFGLSPELKSIENQMFVIRSQKMVKRAIERLNFQVSYMIGGKIKDTELYGNTPFEVVWDSSHVQLVNLRFNISPIDNERFTLSVDNQGGELYDYKRQAYRGSVDPFMLNRQFKYGEPIKSDHYSFTILKKVADVSGINNNHYFFFNTYDALVSQYRNSLWVSPYQEGSSIVILSITGHQPAKMNAFLRVLSQVIMEYNLDKKNEIASRSLSFIGVQLESVADSLKSVQQQMTDFRSQHPFINPTGTGQSISGDYMAREKELQLMRLRLSYLKYLAGNLNERSVLEDYFVLIVGQKQDTDPLVSKMVQDLIALWDERKLLGEDVSGQNPYISGIDKKIAQTRNNLHVALNQMIDNLSRFIDNDSKILSDLKQRLAALPVVEREYAEIDRRYKLNDAIYTFLLQKQSENQIAKASNSSDNEILEEPSVVAVVGPDKKQKYMRGLLIGLLIPGVVIFLREFFNTRVRDINELNGIAGPVPVVGAIPLSSTSSDDVIGTDPSSVCSESFRRLRTKMQYLLSGKDRKVILISSTNTGEGKSFCSFNMAKVFALAGKKTVLLGFDLRKPKLDILCGVNIKHGLSSYLAEQSEIEDILIQLPFKNLTFIGAGDIPPNPAELIAQSRTDKLFGYLRERFDIIVVDTAPIGLVADTRMLVNHADSFLYVTRVDVTHKEHLKMTLDNLLSESVKSLGLVLNGIQSDDKFYGYYGNSYKNKDERAG